MSVRLKQTYPPEKGRNPCHRIIKPPSRDGRVTTRRTRIAQACLPASNLTTAEISLMAEIGSLQKENKKLRIDKEHENRLWREANSLFQNKQGFPEVVELMREKNQLRAKLNAYQQGWATFLPRNMDQITPKDSSEMRKRVFIFQHEYDKLLVTDVIEASCFSRLKGHSEDLDCLLTDVFGMKLATGPQGMSEIFLDDYPYHLVQALVGAALKSWVFQGDFGTHHFAQTELQARSHDILELMWDPDKLYTFDRACHMSVIRDPVYSEEGVPGTVAKFKNRLAEALQPVFESERGRAELNSSLSSVIHAAVMLRAEMLVDSNSYELIWPQVGSLFSRDEMETSRDICNTTSGTVKWPLCPGFQAIPKKAAMIDYAGLTVAATGIPEAECVAKALIW